MSINVKNVSKNKTWFYELRMLHGFFGHLTQSWCNCNVRCNGPPTPCSVPWETSTCKNSRCGTSVSPSVWFISKKKDLQIFTRKDSTGTYSIMFQDCVEHVCTFSRWFIPIYPNTVPDWWTKWTIQICRYPASCLDEPRALKTMAGHMLVFHGPTE